MSYDLHVVRTENWLDAEESPITKPEVDALIAADNDLAWSTNNWVDMRDGNRRKPTRYYMILWQGEPCLWWYRNEIQCSGPTEEQIGKLVEIATKLKARVVGDDGEFYLPENRQPTYRGE